MKCLRCGVELNMQNPLERHSLYCSDACMKATAVPLRVEGPPNKVKNPKSKHYELWEDYETIDAIKHLLTEEEYRGFLKGNMLKYRLRAGKKDNVESDIEKAMDYERELKND